MNYDEFGCVCVCARILLSISEEIPIYYTEIAKSRFVYIIAVIRSRSHIRIAVFF